MSVGLLEQEKLEAVAAVVELMAGLPGPSVATPPPVEYPPPVPARPFVPRPEPSARPTVAEPRREPEPVVVRPARRDNGILPAYIWTLVVAAVPTIPAFVIGTEFWRVTAGLIGFVCSVSLLWFAFLEHTVEEHNRTCGASSCCTPNRQANITGRTDER